MPWCRLPGVLLDGRRDRLEGGSQAVTIRAATLRHLRASAALALDRAQRGTNQVAGRDALRDQVIRDADEHLWLVRFKTQGDDAAAERRSDVLRECLHFLGALERRSECGQANPGLRFGRRRDEVSGPRGRSGGPAASLQPSLCVL